MALCKTAVTQLVTHCSYCRIAVINFFVDSSDPYTHLLQDASTAPRWYYDLAGSDRISIKSINMWTRLSPLDTVNTLPENVTLQCDTLLNLAWNYVASWDSSYTKATIIYHDDVINGNIFLVTGPLWGESTGHRWNPLTKASDAELWYFLWSAPEQTVEETIATPVIWDAIALVMTSLMIRSGIPCYS